ncbi:MAG TPA: hypothetical protein VNT92_10535 [Acidimicrobiia bacterium]|nr:hypothetical protein [Acidimicrobiia bacterium]
MSANRSRTIAWVMWLSGVAMIVLAAVLSEVNPPISTTQVEESALEGAIWLSTWVGFGLVGALVVSSRPANRIGWVMCGITLAVGLSLFAGEYSRFALVTEPGSWPLGEPAAWVATWGFLPVVALVMALVLMYPSGEPSRFGFWILRASLFVTLSDALVFAFRPGPVQGDTPPDNPLGIPGARDLLDPASEWLSTALAVIALIAVVDLVIRFRRSSGVERLQFRWFVLAVAAFPVMFFGANLLEEFVLGVEGFDPVVIAFALWGNGTAAAIGIAVTRHGLYEIDRVISRTVGYALVVLLLGAAYLGAVTWLTSLLPDQSDLVVAASTLGVAALFSPIRRVVLNRVDRRFNRSRYDAEMVMDTFAGSLRSKIDSDELMQGWVRVVSETMQPRVASVWIRDGV